MFKYLGLIACVCVCSWGYTDIQSKKLIPYPIEYSIPAVKIVKEIPEKDLDFASLDPLDIKTYIYTSESDYYAGYQRALFGVTTKKAGWDCLRHYEILANGCIPYFVDLDQCDVKTLFRFPRDLIFEAMNLDGVSYMHIDHSKFDRKRYNEILTQLLQYTRDYLSSEKMAAYLLDTIDYRGSGKILVLSQNDRPEYLRDTILIGLKSSLEDRIIDVPKIPFLYQSYLGDIKKLYGKGMSYTQILPDLDIDRTHLEERIKNREFDLIVYAEIHKGRLPFYDVVKRCYSSDEIVYMYGDEIDETFYPFYLPNLFIREYYLYERTKLRYFPVGLR